MNNRLWNIRNPAQGKTKRVLCVCSAGLLRSPTMAVVLSQEPYNYNTRAAGIDTGHALIVVDQVLICWADEIVCANRENAKALKASFKKFMDADASKVITLDIPDDYNYRDPVLMSIIAGQYDQALKNLAAQD